MVLRSKPEPQERNHALDLYQVRPARGLISLLNKVLVNNSLDDLYSSEPIPALISIAGAYTFSTRRYGLSFGQRQPPSFRFRSYQGRIGKISKIAPLLSETTNKWPLGPV